MDRRKFLAAGAAGIAASPVMLAAPAIAKGKAKHEWKLVTSLPKTLPGPGTSSMRWAERINQMSDGAIKITVYGGGELVPPFGTQEAVENGTAQVYHGSGSWFAGRDLAHSFTSVAPFGALPDEMHAWTYYGGGQELINEFTNPRGLQVFLGGGTGVQTAGWFKKPVNSLADLQGLNFRITGFGAKVLSKIGMNAVSTPPGEIFPALQSGTLDGAEWVGPAFDMAFGLQKIASYMYTPSFSDNYGGIEYGINLKAWEALSDGERTMVETACEAEAARLIADSLHSNMAGFEKLKQVAGLTIGLLPEDVWDALRQASHEVMDDVMNSSDFVGKLATHYYDYVEKASSYKTIYDAPYAVERAKYFA